MQYDIGVQSGSRTLSLHHSRARDHCAADIKQKGLNKAATLVGFFPSSPRGFFLILSVRTLQQAQGKLSEKSEISLTL